MGGRFSSCTGVVVIIWESDQTTGGVFHWGEMIKKVLIGILCGAAMLTAGILIGHFGIMKSGSAPSWVQDMAKDVDESLIEKFLSEVDNIQIQENLKWVDKWSN